jgi:outer membrane lipoprotein carrier protein
MRAQILKSLLVVAIAQSMALGGEGDKKKPELPKAATPAKAAAPSESAAPAKTDTQKKPDLKQTLEKLQAQFDKTEDFSAQFTQKFHHKVLKTDSSSEGNVKFKKPGLMRWDYSKPSTKSFIVDGKSLWVHQPEDKLVMVNKCFKQDTLTASLSFLWGAGNITKQFDAQYFNGQFGDAADLNVQLTPKVKSSHYKRLILVIDSEKFQVKQSIVVDLEGNTNQFKFSGMQLNKSIKSAEFTFTPPKGTHVSEIPGSSDNCK